MTEVQQEIKQETPVIQAQTEAAPPIRSEENQNNWKKFREEREKERKLRMEAEQKAREEAERAKALQEAIEALVSKPEKNTVQEEGEEDRIKKLVAEEIKKRQEEEYKQKQEYEKRTFPQRIREKYKDFDEVCSPHNLDYLEYHYEEIAEPFKHMPDGLDKWERIYKTVKRFVPYDGKEKDEKRIEKNLSKPQANSPVSANRDLSSYNSRLSDERKRANWERMQKELKGLG